MAYKKRNYTRPSRSSRDDYMDHTQHEVRRPPYGEAEDKVSIGLSAKALKDLPHSSFSVTADPYTASLPASQPYPIIAQFNRNVGGRYTGDKNIDGGNVQQYVNSITSKMLSVFDVMRLQIRMNYRYLPIAPRISSNLTIGKALVDEMRKSFAEAVGTLKSTTFTQMAINKFAVRTDLPMGSAETVNINPDSEGTPINAYTKLTDVLYAMSIYYQVFLQNIANTMNWHNSFRLKQGEMIRNAWNREVAALNSLFGLFNKKSFLNKLDSINLSFEGEYVDVDFLKQAGMLNIMPSRRSESLSDPVLELQTSFSRPSVFEVYLVDDNQHAISTTPFYSDANCAFEGPDGDTYSVWDACEKVNDLLSMEATTLWARTHMDVSGRNDTSRFNEVNGFIDIVNSSFIYFKPLWSDFREALDVMARAGIITWRKGFRPSITRNTTAPFFQNLLIEDIYKFILGGAESVTFDDATKRWRTFSLWDMYKGIPEYDTYSGGCFLTFSFKTMSVSADSDANIEYLPVLFDKDETTLPDHQKVECVAVSRDGVEAVISTSAITMSSNAILCRLAPLSSQSSLQLRVPSITRTSSSDVTAAHLSYLSKMLTQVVGYCRTINSSVSNYNIDPDLVAIYQIEIEDVSNMAIAYARTFCPVRGTSSLEGTTLGFMGIAK